MDSVWVAVGGFFGATLGSLIASYLAELYRQKNRLQLAAVEKRLQAHQEAYKWAFDVGVCIMLVQEMENQRPDDSEANHKAKTDLDKARQEALEWWSNNCLYLDQEISKVVGSALTQGGLHENTNACKELAQSVGLPRLADDQLPFRLTISVDK